MAQKSKKNLAKSNEASLYNLHAVTLAVHVVFLLVHFLTSRRRSTSSLLLYAFLSVPSFACEFGLERVGRPRRDPATGALFSSGEDLGAAGLTEYMFDVVWITWAALGLVVLAGNWGWLLWAVVPLYGGYKGFGLLTMARSMMGGGGGAGLPGGVEPGAEPGAPDNSGGGGNRKQRRAV